MVNRREARKKEYDLLCEKIQQLRTSRIIETATAVRFQLEKQIEEAETELAEIEKQLQDGIVPVQIVLSKWNRNDFQQRLVVATDIRMIAVSNYDLISNLSEELKDVIRRGGELRCLYVKPEEQLLQMIASRSIGVEKKLEHLLKGNVINPLMFLLTNKTENARGDTRTNEEEETRIRGYN